MRVILVCAISVDGKVAKSVDDGLFWTGREEKKWFAELTRRVGVLVIGRKTYEQMRKVYERLGNAKKLTAGRLLKVITRSPEKYKSVSGKVEFVGGDLKKMVSKLEDKGFSEVVVGGGPEISRLFLENCLVDEVWLSVVPILWGKGLDLVSKGGLLGVQLGLTKAERLGDDGMVLKYQVLKQDQR